MDTRKIVHRNLVALMVKKFGKENFAKVARDLNWSPNQGTLIKKEETYIGLEKVEQIANYFEVEPWMVIYSNFNPDNMPVKIVTESELLMYRKIDSAMQELKELSNL